MKNLKSVLNMNTKQSVKVIAVILMASSLFLAGSLLSPTKGIKADATPTPQTCQIGYHTVVNLGVNGTTYDCEADTTPPPSNTGTDPNAGMITAGTPTTNTTATTPTTTTTDGTGCQQ